MRIIKDCYLIHGKDTHHFSKQEICKGRFGYSEVDVNAEAADFASKSHSTSLPKSTQLQEAWEEHPCAVGRRCRAVPQALRKAGGCCSCCWVWVTRCLHCVGFPLGTSGHCLLCDCLTCSPEFTRSHIHDYFLRGKNIISNST